MRFSSTSHLNLLAFVAAISALTITEPTENTVINPQQPFTVKWTSTSSDPQTLIFSITGAGDFAITQYQEIARNVQTSAGSVQIPANTLGTFGQYKIEARDASTSTVVTTSPGFYLAQGNDQTISITSNGGASGDGGLSGTVTLPTQAPTGTMTSGDPQISVVTGENGTSIILSGTREPSSTPLRTTTSHAGTSTSSPTPTQSPNAQRRLGEDGNKLILSMAGIVAGLVALIA